MSKLNSKWVALCTLAVGVVYGSGYVVTELKNPSQSYAATTQTQQTSQIQSSSQGSSAVQNPVKSGLGSTNSNSVTSSNTTSSSAASTGTYKDGTYQGTGSNQYGTVSVSVTIKSGNITSVQITNCETHYPEQAITPLPEEVVATQSANVEIVSGATGSSEDFQTAVQDALQQAQI